MIRTARGSYYSPSTHVFSTQGEGGTSPPKPTIGSLVAIVTEYYVFCPGCRRHMSPRKGRYGWFWFCKSKIRGGLRKKNCPTKSFAQVKGLSRAHDGEREIRVSVPAGVDIRDMFPGPYRVVEETSPIGGGSGSYCLGA